MPKPNPVESRHGWLGGLNIAAASDMLDADELLQCVNARVEPFGAVMRRPGSVKLHATMFGDGDPIIGIKQWGPNNEIVAASRDGNLYHAVAPYTTFTQYVPVGNTFQGDIVDWATARAAVAGAPLVLYFTSNNGLWKWNGSAISVVSTPNGPSLVRAYGPRLFTNDTAKTKHIFWSALGDPEDWTTGGTIGTGSALVDTLSGDSIVALENSPGSLLIGTNESISRFSGVSDDIQIAQDSAGVSTEIGPSGSEYSGSPFLRMEQMVLLHSERGFFAASDGGVLNIGNKIVNPRQTALRVVSSLTDSIGLHLPPALGHNRRRSEAWYAYVPIGGTMRTHVLVYNYRLQCWYGPFIYPFGIYCLGTYEDANGIESIMAGCHDGFIRLLDDIDNATDFDDDTDDFDSTVQFAPFCLSGGPRSTKSLRHIFLQVIGETTFDITATGDLGQSDTAVLVF
jgi:hypothetical protein